MNQSDSLRPRGVFTYQHVRDGKVIDEWTQENLVVDEGLNYALNSALGNVTPVSAWYMTLFSANYTPVAGLTAATFNASATEYTGYSETVRQTWNLTGSTPTSTKQLTNSANRATFTISTGTTLYGSALMSSNAKGGGTGTLFAAARFDTARTVASGDQLLVAYTIAAA